VAKHRPRLNVFGRQLLVRRIVELGWPVATAADASGVSRATAHKWLRRFREEGDAGLADRSSRPHRSPRRLAPGIETAILALRDEHRMGPHRLSPLVGYPRSTIGKVLARHGVARLRDLDRPTGAPIRYVREHPGELVHQDHKKPGRIPDGGGHRVVGRGQGKRNRRGMPVGYDHFEVIVDDMSRFAVVVPVPDESGSSAAQALSLAASVLAGLGVRVERVLTDNAIAYTHSRAYADVLTAIGARHKRTAPYRPQTNGKAERFIRTMLDEWAYARPYPTNAERLAALPGWVHHYDHTRHHTALDGRTPAEVLVNKVRGKHT
jgi:transposase InsO family protein